MVLSLSLRRKVKSKSREVAAPLGSHPLRRVVTHFGACHFPSCCWQRSLLYVCVHLSLSFSWDNLSNLQPLLSLHVQANLLEQNEKKKKVKYQMRGFELNGLPVPITWVCGGHGGGMGETCGRRKGRKEDLQSTCAIAMPAEQTLIQRLVLWHRSLTVNWGDQMVLPIWSKWVCYRVNLICCLTGIIIKDTIE